jgi:hypothetical protein
VKAGTLDARHELHPDQQVLRLRAVDTDHLQYWGLGNFSVTPLGCANVVTSSHWPPRFFEILRRSSSANKVGDGNTCWAMTWQIDSKADTITGSCFANENDHYSLKFEWNLKRTGGAPGG